MLGGLFGTTKVRDNREEVLVLITPTVIRDPMEARRLTDEYGARFRGPGALAQGAGEAVTCPRRPTGA